MREQQSAGWPMAKLDMGARFLKIKVLLAVEGGGERFSMSMSPSSSEKSSFETDSLFAPADDEPDTEEGR